MWTLRKSFTRIWIKFKEMRIEILKNWEDGRKPSSDLGIKNSVEIFKCRDPRSKKLVNKIAVLNNKAPSKQ